MFMSYDEPRPNAMHCGAGEPRHHCERNHRHRRTTKPGSPFRRTVGFSALLRRGPAGRGGAASASARRAQRSLAEVLIEVAAKAVSAPFLSVVFFLSSCGDDSCFERRIVTR